MEDILYIYFYEGYYQSSEDILEITFLLRVSDRFKIYIGERRISLVLKSRSRQVNGRHEVDRDEEEDIQRISTFF